MKHIFVINLKKGLKNLYLHIYVRRFLNMIKWQCKFIKVQLILVSYDDQRYEAGSNIIVNLRNERSIDSYRLTIIDELKKYMSIPDMLPIKQIIFKYEEFNKKSEIPME